MDDFTGTKDVAASHAFDLHRLQVHLQAHLRGFAGPLTVQQFKGGQSNPTYQLMTPNATYVMRTKPGPSAKLLPSAHAVEREFRVMNALSGSAVPVPRMHLLCEDETVIGRAFYVMDFVAGRVLWDPALPGFSKPDRAAVYDEMNRVLAALHTVDVAAVGLSTHGRPGNYFERQIARWSKQYLASRTQSLPAMDQLIEWLPQHLPAAALDASQVSVVHGDFRLDNLMFDIDASRVIAVLDWELSTLGHPLADFSYHCMTWHIPPGVFRGIGGVDLAPLGIPDEASYIRRYCERTGRTDSASLQRDWNYYLAYNLFRLASITQGIAKRVIEGTAASAQACSSGDKTPALAEMALKHARLHDPALR